MVDYREILRRRSLGDSIRTIARSGAAWRDLPECEFRLLSTTCTEK